MNKDQSYFSALTPILFLILFLFSIHGQSVIPWDVGDGRGNGGDGIYLFQSNNSNQLEPCDQSEANQIWLYDFFELFYLLNNNKPNNKPDNQLSISDFTFFNQDSTLNENETLINQTEQLVINQLNQWTQHKDNESQSLARVLLAILSNSIWSFDYSNSDRNNPDTLPIIERIGSSLLKCAISNHNFQITLYNQCFNSGLIKNPSQLSGLISHEIIYILFSTIVNGKTLNLADLSSQNNASINQNEIDNTNKLILEIQNHINQTLGLDPNYSTQQSLIVRIINQALYYQYENKDSIKDVIIKITDQYNQHYYQNLLNHNN